MTNFTQLQSNWIDLVILAVFIFYLYEGWGRGFILGMVDLSGFLFSFIISLKYYGFIGDLLVSRFSWSRGIANATGFLICGFLIEIIFSFLINLCYRKLYPVIMKQITDRTSLSYGMLFNRLLGLIPATGEALVFVAFFLTLLVTLPIQGAVKKDIVSSRIGGILTVKTQGIEQKLNSIFGQAVNESLTFLTINSNPTSEESIDLRFTQKDTKEDESAETTMFNLINQERINNNLRHLSFSFELRDLAREFARDMFGKGYFSHFDPESQSPFERMQKKNITFLAAGENLAFAPNVHLAHEGLMNSPGHRANILSADFGKVGIGVIDGGIYGEMFVQEFTN